MVQTNNLMKSGIIGALATAASAQSLFTPIDYKSTLDLNYYFRNASDVKATVNDEGIDIEGSFGSNSELCAALKGAQIVYSKDNGDDVLLTADCQSVYHLVDESNDEITWDSCQEFSFYPSECSASNGTVSSSAGYSSLVSSAAASASAQGASSQSITKSESTTATASYAENSISNGETLYLTTVTSTHDDVLTTYTTYCPISDIIASRSHAQVTGGTTNINAKPAPTSNANSVYTSTFVSTSDGSVGTFTSLYPLTGDASSSQSNGQKPGRVYVTNTDYYEIIASQSSAAASAAREISSSSSERPVTVITETHSGVETVYTTYCPESSVASSYSAPAPVVPSSSSIPVETSSAVENTAVSTQAAAPASAAPAPASVGSSAASAPAAVSASLAPSSAAASVSVIEPQTQATDVSIVSESAASSAPASSAAAAAQGSSSVSVAQQQSSAGSTASSPQISVYEGGAGRLFNSVSAVSIVAIVFGFFC